MALFQRILMPSAREQPANFLVLRYDMSPTQLARALEEHIDSVWTADKEQEPNLGGTTTRFILRDETRLVQLSILSDGVSDTWLFVFCIPTNP